MFKIKNNLSPAPMKEIFREHINSSPLVGSDPKVIDTHNEESADLSDHSPPLLVSDSELNQSAQSQEPHFLSSSEEEVGPSFYSSTEVNENDSKPVLQALKAKNLDRPIIAHLNIKFFEPKYEPLKALIKQNVDILLVSETKLGDPFPKGQFNIEGYEKLIRLDRDRHGGGILFFIRDDIPCIELKSLSNIEGIFIELTIRNSKWLLMGGGGGGI